MKEMLLLPWSNAQSNSKDTSASVFALDRVKSRWSKKEQIENDDDTQNSLIRFGHSLALTTSCQPYRCVQCITT
jgi:hypothetical protein